MFMSLATPRRLLSAAAVLMLAVLPARAAAQSAAEHIALGDRDHTAMNAPGALKHYEAAITADPKSYEALWKAAREAVDVGEFNANDEERDRALLDRRTIRAPRRRGESGRRRGSLPPRARARPHARSRWACATG